MNAPREGHPELAALPPELRDVLHAWGLRRPSDAARRVLRSPGAELGDEGHGSLAKTVRDAVDASVFGEPHQVFLTFQNLRAALETRAALDAVPGLGDELELLAARAGFVANPDAMARHFSDPNRTPWTRACGAVLRAERENRLLSYSDLSACFSLIPPGEQGVMERWLCLVQGHVLFRTVKPSLYAALGSPPRPETPLTYEGGLPTEALLERVAEAHAAGSVPAIFFEPYALDWERLRLALAGQPALFVLRDRMLLGHALHFPALLETLLAPEHVIYGLSAFPEDLLREQPALGSTCAARSEGSLFCPIFLEASPDEVPERSRKLRALALVEQWLRARQAASCAHSSPTMTAADSNPASS